MSTLKLENIGHPDAAGNALEFGADGSIVSRGSVSKYGAIVTNARGDGIVTRSAAEGTPTNWVSYHHGLDFNGHNITSGAVSARGDYMSMSSNWYIEDSAGQERFKTSGYPATNYFQSNGGHFFQRSTATPVADTAPNMVTSMVISNQGYVSTPYHPAFSAYNTTQYQPGAGVDAVKPFDTVRFNVGGHFDTTNYRFTAPINGTYHFTWGGTLQFTTADGYATSYLIINGSSAGTARVRDSQTSGGAYYGGAMGSEYHQLSAGDYVEVWCYSQNGGVVFHSNEFVFMGRLIG